MIETDLGKVLNYMKQYVENKYLHDSEPMLNYKDLQLVLGEIERLNNIINELEITLNLKLDKIREPSEYNKGLNNAFLYIKNKLEILKGVDKE